MWLHSKRLMATDFQANRAIGPPAVMPRHSRATTHSRSIGLSTPNVPYAQLPGYILDRTNKRAPPDSLKARLIELARRPARWAVNAGLNG